jgi:hypothetical protein
MTFALVTAKWRMTGSPTRACSDEIDWRSPLFPVIALRVFLQTVLVIFVTIVVAGLALEG